MGAWIETSRVRAYIINNESHPTWVRGLKHHTRTMRNRNGVAPYVGAWIETNIKAKAKYVTESHPTWVRGLKQLYLRVMLPHKPSHPTWVRGLKQIFHCCDVMPTTVAPYVGAWIETRNEKRE